MTQAAYPGVVRGGMVHLNNETPLTEGTQVLVTPVADAPGSAAAVLAAMESSPKVPVEWMDELERLIAQGRRPPSPPASFLDEPAAQEPD